MLTKSTAPKFGAIKTAGAHAAGSYSGTLG